MATCSLDSHDSRFYIEHGKHRKHRKIRVIGAIRGSLNVLREAFCVLCYALELLFAVFFVEH